MTVSTPCTALRREDGSANVAGDETVAPQRDQRVQGGPLGGVFLRGGPYQERDGDVVLGEQVVSDAFPPACRWLPASRTVVVMVIPPSYGHRAATASRYYTV